MFNINIALKIVSNIVTEIKIFGTLPISADVNKLKADIVPMIGIVYNGTINPIQIRIIPIIPVF
jgi:hypothetical protein